MKRRRIAVVLLLVVIIGGSLWYLNAYHGLLARVGLSTPAPPGVLASGFIEATDVSIAPETGGRIVSISAVEGDEVTAGTIMLKLDDTVPKAQEKQGEAAIRLAEASLEQAAASRSQAVVARDGAKKVLENALDVQKNPLELEAQITAAQSQLKTAELALSFQKQVVDAIPGAPKSLYWNYTLSRQQWENAKAALQSLEAIRSNPQEINGIVEKARTASDSASAAVETAEKAVLVAERQVAQAMASLEVIRAQIGKLAVASPVSGQVAARNAEPGEIAQPGAAVLTVTRIDEMTLTAFVPESKLGLVKVGQEAAVSVDSYPGEEFSGRVVSIGTRALFTPKNVQLKEEREKTMYPVKIRLANPERKLKAGMPADARILVP